MATWYPVDVQLSIVNKKFIDKFYQDSDYKISPVDIIGPIIIGSLRKTPFNFKPQEDLPGLATFKVEQHNVWGRGKYIPLASQKLINKQIDNLFNLKFNTFILLYIQEDDRKVMDAIHAFCTFFDITDEEIALDSLKKRFFRIRSEVNNVIINDLEQNHKHFDIKSAVLAKRLTVNPLKAKELKECHVVSPFFNHLFTQFMTA